MFQRVRLETHMDRDRQDKSGIEVTLYYGTSPWWVIYCLCSYKSPTLRSITSINSFRENLHESPITTTPHNHYKVRFRYIRCPLRPRHHRTYQHPRRPREDPNLREGHHQQDRLRPFDYYPMLGFLIFHKLSERYIRCYTLSVTVNGVSYPYRNH